ncbi:zeta toxin family protein [Streptomyces albidoflavus]
MILGRHSTNALCYISCCQQLGGCILCRPRTRGDAPHGLNAVVESALADPDDFRALSEAYRRFRHQIEVVALATPEALRSHLIWVTRYSVSHGRDR